jgi:hypothetical protein
MTEQTLTPAHRQALIDTINTLSNRVHELEHAAAARPAHMPKVALPEKFDGTPNHCYSSG